MDSFEFLNNNLSKADIWQQLSEEAAELSQAASKMERFYRGSNPPRKGLKELVADVVEEHADVALCFRLLDWEDKEQRKIVELFKAKRWARMIRHAGETARWEISSDGYYPYCSACKEQSPSGELTDYCLICGAKMENPDEQQMQQD